MKFRRCALRQEHHPSSRNWSLLKVASLVVHPTEEHNKLSKRLKPIGIGRVKMVKFINIVAMLVALAPVWGTTMSGAPAIANIPRAQGW